MQIDNSNWLDILKASLISFFLMLCCNDAFAFSYARVSLDRMLIVFGVLFWIVTLVCLCLLCFFVKRKPKVSKNNQDHA